MICYFQYLYFSINYLFSHIIFILFIFYIFGCKNSYQDVSILDPDKIIYKLNDGTYFSSGGNIQKYNNHFFINDFKNDRVIKLDSLLHLRKTFGRIGRGPGEFRFVGPIIANQDSLYIYDGGGMRFHVYYDGDYVRSFNIPYLLSDARVTLIDNKLYMSSPYTDDNNSSIFVTDLKGNVVKYFDKNPLNNSRINYTNRLLFSSVDNNKIIAIPESEPFVELYSKEGKFLKSFDLRKIESLGDLWNYYNEKKTSSNRNNKSILFTDAYIDGTLLYINCAGWPGRDDFTYLIQLEVENQSIRPLCVFKIRGADEYKSLFKTIGVDGNLLLATEVSSQGIYKFDLSKLKHGIGRMDTD